MKFSTMETKVVFWLSVSVLFAFFISIALRPFLPYQARQSQDVFYAEGPVFWQIGQPAANQETDNKKSHLSNMPEPFWSLFCTILGGAISAATGFWAFHYERKAKAKMRFKIFMRIKLSKIPPVNHPIAWLSDVFYTSTRDDIRDEISKVEPFIKTHQIEALERLWSDYADPNAEQALKGGMAGFAAEFEMKKMLSVHKEENFRKFFNGLIEAVDLK